MSLSRRFASATFQLTAASTFARLLSLVTLPLLTRWLTPDSYGAAALIATAISLISVVALAGVDMTYTRAFRSTEPPNGEVVERFAWRWAIGAALLLAVLSLLLWDLVFAQVFELPGYLGLLLAAGIVCAVGQTMAQVRARLQDRYDDMAISVVVSGFGSVAVGLAVAYFWPKDGVALVLGMVVASLLPVLMLGVPPLRSLLTASSLTAGQRLTLLQIGYAGVLTAPMYWVMSSLDRWFLGFYEGANSVGIYSVGYSVAALSAVFNTAIQAAWLPEATRAYEQDTALAGETLGKLAERLVVCMGLVWLAITASGGDVIRLLAGPNFHSAAEVVPLLAAAVFFNGVLQFAMSGLLLSKRLLECVPVLLIGGLVCFVLNIFLVPLGGRLAAAGIQALVFGLVAVVTVISSQRHFKMHLRAARLGLIFLLIVVSGVFLHAPYGNGSPVLSLMIKFPLGVLVSWIAISAIAPQAIPLLFQSLRKRAI